MFKARIFVSLFGLIPLAFLEGHKVLVKTSRFWFIFLGFCFSGDFVSLWAYYDRPFVVVLFWYFF